MSQEPRTNSLLGQCRSKAETREIFSVQLYIGVIKHLTPAAGAPSFGNLDTGLANPGDIIDILAADNALPANIYRGILNIQFLRASLTVQNIKSSIVSVVNNAVSQQSLRF